MQLVPGMTEHDTREYLQLVYDRQHSLPKSMNIWVTAFDDLVNNASQRLEQKHLRNARVAAHPTQPLCAV
ncbi:MAG: hypothetical protein R2881_10160 [Eubacteriales bacterium]